MAVSARIPAAFQPVFGAILGLCGYSAVALLPRGPGAVAALAFWVLATLAEGERGIARWFAKLPLFGSLLGACTVLIRWYALMSTGATPGIVSAMAIGPAGSVLLAWVSRPVDDSADERLSVLSPPQATIAFVIGIAATFLFGFRLRILLAIVFWMLFRAVAALVNWRWRGVRGSDLDAFRVIVESTLLAIMGSVGPRLG